MSQYPTIFQIVLPALAVAISGGIGFVSFLAGRRLDTAHPNLMRRAKPDAQQSESTLPVAASESVVSVQQSGTQKGGVGRTFAFVRHDGSEFTGHAQVIGAVTERREGRIRFPTVDNSGFLTVDMTGPSVKTTKFSVRASGLKHPGQKPYSSRSGAVRARDVKTGKFVAE